MNRKPWKNLTNSEILKLSREQCVDCKYYSRVSLTASKINSCDYIGIEGHMRGCDPRDCVVNGIYQKRKSKKKRQPAWRCKTNNGD